MEHATTQDLADCSGRCAVVVVNYGSHRMLADGLAKVDLPVGRFLVVVVDNFSTRCERDAMRELCVREGWEFVSSATNAGFGAGVNAGLRRAVALGAASFVLLNPDVHVSGDVLAELRAHVHKDPYAVVSPTLRTLRGDIEFNGSSLNLLDGTIRARTGSPASGGEQGWQPWLPATCLAMHSRMLAEVGLFDEPYFMYWEDVDFTYRCAAAGASLVVRRDLEADHVGGGTQGQRRGVAKSNRYYRYNCRNRLMFAARHLDRRRLVRWMICTPSVSWQILLQGGRRQLLRSPKPLLAAMSGAAAGLAIAAQALVMGVRSPVAEPPPRKPSTAGLQDQMSA